MGAFMGDSLGSFCEFQRNPATQSVDQAMQMYGGGPFGLLPGQVTDDSEIALSMAYGLVEGKGILNLNNICKYYCQWINSDPFDIGNTINQAFVPLKQIKFKKEQDFSQIDCSLKVKTSAYIRNQQSLSNGCLMRITPLIIFCSQLQSTEDIINAVRREVELTHPNIVAQDACVAYVLAGIEIINSGSLENALERAKQFIFNKSKVYELITWWNEIIEPEILIEANPNIGFLKIAWTYCFVYIKKIINKKILLNYKKIIHEIISQGGDTDTNACIVGGLLGAKIGADNLPEDYIEIFLTCKSEDNGRPPEYSPSNIIKLCQQILDIAPKNLQIEPLLQQKLQ